jgi:hypothetical protein
MITKIFVVKESKPGTNILVPYQNGNGNLYCAPLIVTVIVTEIFEITGKTLLPPLTCLKTVWVGYIFACSECFL